MLEELLNRYLLNAHDVCALIVGNGFGTYFLE